MLSAVLAPATLAGVTAVPLQSGANRATRVAPIDHRRVTAELYMERANGSSLHDTHRAAAGATAQTRWLNASGMVIILHRGWIG